MNTLMIIFLTLLVYSTISTIIFIISKENNEIAIYFGLGIFGIVLILISKLIRKIYKSFRRIKYKSIFLNITTNENEYCNLKDTNNINWTRNYKLLKRYALKTEIKDLKMIPKDIVEKAKINCDNCVYNCNENCEKCKDYINFENFKKK